MTRLHVHVEGQTEEMFVNGTLAGHLVAFGFSSITARLIGNARMRAGRGGRRSWAGVREEIIRHLKQDDGCYSTLMVDYYALPDSGSGAWPGRNVASHLPYTNKSTTVEDALHQDIVNGMGAGFDPARFVPFVVMHEFEGLLFSDCGQLAGALGRLDLVPSFQQIRNGYETPEEINDGVNTAPSKRILTHHRGYQKVIDANRAMTAIGMPQVRAQCPIFARWLDRLENLL